MEMEKKKRSHNGEADGRRTKLKDDKGDLTADPRETEAATLTATSTATEEEVEEFFAILRRVHEVVRYFGKGKNGGGGGGGEMRSAIVKGWNPSFRWEDFDDVHGKQYGGSVVSDNSNKGNKIKGGREKKDVEAVEENLVAPAPLDLNVKPESLAEMN